MTDKLKIILILITAVIHLSLRWSEISVQYFMSSQVGYYYYLLFL